MFKKFNETYKIPLNLLESIEQNEELKIYLSHEERENYLNLWRNKQCEYHEPYNETEYKLYMKISSENKYMNEIQRTHYIDNGCLCMACNTKRSNIIEKVEKGENVEVYIDHENSKREYIEKRIKDAPIIIRKKQIIINKNKSKIRNTFKGLQLGNKETNIFR
jgi:TusA-related sulfurtransferase